MQKKYNETRWFKGNDSKLRMERHLSQVSRTGSKQNKTNKNLPMQGRSSRYEALNMKSHR